LGYFTVGWLWDLGVSSSSIPGIQTRLSEITTHGRVEGAPRNWPWGLILLAICSGYTTQVIVGCY